MLRRAVACLPLLTLLVAGCSLFRRNANSSASSQGSPSTVAAKPQTISVSDLAEREFARLKSEEEAALLELDLRVREPQTLPAAERAFHRLEANRDLIQRLSPLRQRLRDFLNRHPQHAPAWIAYGGLLTALSEEKEAITSLQRALELDGTRADAWNNLATLYGTMAVEQRKGEFASVALGAYDKAIACAPHVALYHNSLAILISLFPMQAGEHYRSRPERMPALALNHFRKAGELDPGSFAFAADLAEAHLGLRPLRKADALAAWDAAHKLARTPQEVEWVHLQTALLELEDGRPDRAQEHLMKVTSPAYDKLKARIALALKGTSVKPSRP